MPKTAVFLIKRDGFRGLERETIARVQRQLMCEGSDRSLDLCEVDGRIPLGAGGICEYKDHDVFVLVYGEVLITREAISALSRIVLSQEGPLIIGPVGNESKVPFQIQGPPFLYQTITVFKWAVRKLLDQFGEDVIAVEEVDELCLAFGRQVLEGLPRDVQFDQLLRVIRDMGLRLGIARGVYVHVYGNCYESAREDLLAHVPLDSRDVLDIGCANGLFGEVLKKRQKCTVTGIDSDPEAVKIAKTRLDHVRRGDIEEVIDKGDLGIFDCIVCGDTLEHLNNPWKALKGLKRHLRKGGLLVASVPNVANWAIIYEMLKGRWDYVPFTILSGTHLRFFTRDSLKECFEDAGYRIKKTYFQSFEIPPEGDEFIAVLKKNMVDMDEEELRASEIVLVAE